MAQSLIKLENVSKTYSTRADPIRALQDVCLELYGGDFVAIMGPSGSGKSTLLHIIGCLDQPTSGNVWLDGDDLSKHALAALWKIRNHKIGFVFQQHHLIPTLTALENVMLPLHYSGCAKNTAKQKARDLLIELGLGDRQTNRPGQLSGGEQARVGIARALINQPLVILADEPTGELDSHTGKQVMELLAQRVSPETVCVVITHDQEVANYCQWTATMRDGRIMYS